MTFRIEKKYRLTSSDQKILKAKIIKEGALNLYPKRLINSCYFDTYDYKCFFESEEGSMPRKKTRIRWYDNKNIFYKETKISSIEGRFKTISKFNKNNLSEIYKHKIFDKNYGLLKPVILINYERSYYKYKGIRITFDEDIRYTDLNTKTKKTLKDFEVVLEIKANISTSLDYLENLIDARTARFSKFSRGILSFRKSL